MCEKVCAVNDCDDDAVYSFVANLGDGLRYEIEVCERHFDQTTDDRYPVWS